jgi:hypothetical protein
MSHGIFSALLPSIGSLVLHFHVFMSVECLLSWKVIGVFAALCYISVTRTQCIELSEAIRHLKIPEYRPLTPKIWEDL